MLVSPKSELSLHQLYLKTFWGKAPVRLYHAPRGSPLPSPPGEASEDIGNMPVPVSPKAEG